MRILGCEVWNSLGNTDVTFWCCVFRRVFPDNTTDKESGANILHALLYLARSRFDPMKLSSCESPPMMQ
jgi:hypothetical protein